MVPGSSSPPDGYLPEANASFRAGRYASAVRGYVAAIQRNGLPANFIQFNLDSAFQRLVEQIRANAAGREPGRVSFNESIIRIIEQDRERIRLATALAVSEKAEAIGDGVLVSIVMPTWNRANVIREAIDSVCDQFYRHWELIVCDDASEDNTQEVVASYGDERIRYLKLQKGNGAIARNYGLKMAKGGIIAFLDSDNIWSPAYLQRVVERFAAGATIAYTGYIDAVLEGDRYTSAEFKFREFDFLALAHRNYIDLNTVSFLPSLLTDHGAFDPELPRQQDWDLLIRYTAHHHPVGIAEPLVLYRRNREWGQVTETQKHIDTRSVVMAKNAALVSAFKRGSSRGALARAADPAGRRLIAIKISAPDESVAFEWGDYHFALQLGAALARRGWSYVVHCRDQWYVQDGDVNLVLRGRHRFETSRSAAGLNLLWIISHPDRLAHGELNDFDHVFVASDTFVRKAERVTHRPVSVLHQATDPGVFHPCASPLSLPSDTIFVGNSRNEYRELVKWSVEQGIRIALWGTRWEQFVSPEMIVGQHIPNADVAAHYSSSKILLNDHWATMRSNGFLSNRLFDASAAGAFIISDRVQGLHRVFGDTIETAGDSSELRRKVDYYLRHDYERRSKAAAARDIVLKWHTFDARAAEIDAMIGMAAARAEAVPATQ